MGRILDIIKGRGERSTRNIADGSTLGLTTPATWRGNTAYGPSGGYATQFSTVSPTTGRVSNVRQVSSSDWRAAQSRPQQPRTQPSGTGGGLFGGGARGTSTSTKARSFSSARSGDVSGPRKDASGRNASSATRRKAGGVVKSKWIQSAIKKPGALRSALKVKKGSPISTKKLASAAKKPGKMGQRARLAMTLKSFRKGK